MLNDETIKIVQSTAPVLKEHSKQIGITFYRLLFDKAPELYNLFNQTNQKRGLQQEALGYAVYAAGEHITDLSALNPVIERICHKHRAIGIMPEQYPIVGETLLQAVKVVLGDAATDEILDAWGQAYGYISEAFISLEKKLYDETEKQHGGWSGYRDFYIDHKVKETDEITSFYLKPKDGKEIATYKPGQYLTIKAAVPGEQYTHVRHYSISDSPNKEYYRISVKREDRNEDGPAGIVSNFLHENNSKGGTFAISAPAGDFVLKENDRPIVFISGGIGVTPMMSMLNTLMENKDDRQITFVHAAANSETHAFKEHVETLTEKNSNLDTVICYSMPTDQDLSQRNFDKEGFINKELISSISYVKDAEIYFCGSIPFMQAINHSLEQLKIPMEQINYEVFNPIAMLDE
ncbi:NO-inducible flavohemoprotein [Terribacillus saccharophilus]|uniref:NO-inducible flavohemoprotein n=1 Tax=Terribacillus saccharophilus TaxID=361277 RepID=UPI003982032D